MSTKVYMPDPPVVHHPHHRPSRALSILTVSEWSRDSLMRRYITTTLIIFCYILVIITCPFSLLFTMKRIKEYERAVVLGSTLDSAVTKGPGLVFVLPMMEHYRKIDIRTKE